MLPIFRTTFFQFYMNPLYPIIILHHGNTLKCYKRTKTKQHFISADKCQTEIARNNMESNSETSPGNYKRIQVWSDADTKMLLDKYCEYMEEIGPLQKFRNKKEMWAQVAVDVGNKTGKQCEERYKTVMKRKKQAIDNNSTSGAKRQKIDFEEELQKICASDDSLQPEVRISSQNLLVKDKSTYIKIKKHTPTVTMQQKLLEFNKEKEAAKERRHTEKMERADKLHELLSKVIQKNTE